MKYIEGNSFSELYSKVMDQIYNHPDYESSPRGLKIKECLKVVLQLNNPLNNLFKCPWNKALTLPTGYTKKEIALYLKATDDVGLFTKASASWDKIKNKDGKTINSAYGNLIFNPSLQDGRSQFDWAFDCLMADRDSRQAFIRFNNTSHQYEGVKDLPCTFIGIFHIRDNKLNFTIEVRSNDIVKGLIHDEPSFTLFQYLMYLKLKDIYPELEIGTYTHIANSLHLYESDFEITKNRLDCGIVENKFPMPNDWRVIKSSDIDKIVDIKVNKKQDDSFNEKVSLKDNIDFYNWILS